MKKIFGMLASFVLGFAFFAAGGAVAIETTEPQTTVEPTPTVEATPTVEPTSEPVVVNGPTRSNDNPVFCWNIGKGNELDGDCFCVEGYVTDMIEVDCLIASGIVPESSRDDYRRQLGLTD